MADCKDIGILENKLFLRITSESTLQETEEFKTKTEKRIKRIKTTVSVFETRLTGLTHAFVRVRTID